MSLSRAVIIIFHLTKQETKCRSVCVSHEPVIAKAKAAPQAVKFSCDLKFQSKGKQSKLV
jgi:hypothetical protein